MYAPVLSWPRATAQPVDKTVIPAMVAKAHTKAAVRAVLDVKFMMIPLELMY
jgi:hypothetical protein